MKGMRSTALKVIAFVVIAGLFATTIALTMRGVSPAGPTYAAMFANSSGLKADEDVRAAGVTVGRVKSVDIVQPNNQIKVTFTAQNGFPMRTTTGATIKYKNLIGDRYLSLSQGPAELGPGQPLQEGGTIPATQTHPALSLDELYNGFSPLFEGLQPDQINQLTTSLVMVLQGEGPSVNTLLTQVGSLTGTLADRDQVIGSLIDNLNGILGTLDARRSGVNDLVVNLTAVVSGLSKDRTRIGDSVKGINDLTDSLADVLHDARKPLKDNVHQIDRFASVVNAKRDELDKLFKKAPGIYPNADRVGSYLSAFQFYLCGLQTLVATTAGTPDPAGFGPPILTPIIPIVPPAGAEPRCHY